jgi:hypothetical protein
VKKSRLAPRPVAPGAAAAIGVIKAGATVAAALGHALHGQIGERCDTSPEIESAVNVAAVDGMAVAFEIGVAPA